MTVYGKLLKQKRHASAVPSRGPNVEQVGAQLVLKNPRARLSRTESRNLLFGQLGEVLWYLSGKDSAEIIKYYIPKYPLEREQDPKVVRSAYGPRLFKRKGPSQLHWIVDLLRTNPGSRRAVIPIYNPDDTFPHPEVPCTCTLQFMNRAGRLVMVTHMRSNDAWLGLPGDIFAFTMLQELVARSLGLELGRYHHLVGSLHLYDRDRNSAQVYLTEGYQQSLPMPTMPLGDQCATVIKVLRAEILIRHGRSIGQVARLGQYWGDIARLLQIYAAYQRKDHSAISKIRRAMKDSVYNTYIDRRYRAIGNTAANNQPEALTLDLKLEQGEIVK